MRYRLLKEQILQTCLRMNVGGINQGTSGNLSVRVDDDWFLVTASGVAYDKMQLDDIVETRFDGSFRGHRIPSSEWQIHRDLLVARQDAGAVLHCHPMFATTLACLGRDIPSFHYMVAVAGGDSIPCAPYATFGTPELSLKVLTAMAQRKACLMANHGMVVVAETLERALKIAVEVETLAAMYHRTLQLGSPNLLSAEEMRTVLKKFETYGKQSVPKWARESA